MVMRLTEKDGADEEADGDGGECGKTLKKKNEKRRRIDVEYIFSLSFVCRLLRE